MSESQLFGSFACVKCRNSPIRVMDDPLPVSLELPKGPPRAELGAVACPPVPRKRISDCLITPGGFHSAAVMPTKFVRYIL